MAENNPLKSDYDPIIWSNNGVDGKVRIIDPNPLGQLVPQEDLFTYVSLKAQQRSKTLLTKSDNNNSIKVENFVRNSIDLTVPQQTTELVDGSKLFSNVAALSTKWTEIGGSPFKDLGKDFEGFGITNIDIEIKSQTNPKVVIDFIDVRGATLMEQGSCSPYGLFFNLPYPVFTLTVKGYYGRPVSYYLNLVKFNSKFNSETGNIECRGEFIGWTFGFLSDVLVSYATAAQYLDESLYGPQDKLKKKYEDTWNYYINSGFVAEGSPNPFCNIQNSDGTTRCKTIKDFLTDNDILSKNTLPDIKGSTEFGELDNILKLKTLTDEYLKSVTDFEIELKKLIGTEPIPSSNKKGTLSKYYVPNISGQAQATQFLATEKGVKIKELLRQYFDKNSGRFPITIKTIKELQIREGVFGFDFLTGKESALLTKATKEQLSNTDGNKLIFNVLEGNDYIKIFQNGLIGDPNNIGYKNGGENNGTFLWIDIGILSEAIENDLEALNQEIDKRRNTVIDAINNKLTTVVGFNPSIRNIFTVILCNCDAFMDILKEVSIKAEEYHDSSGDKPDEKLLSGDKIYAWPTYMELASTNSSSDSQAKKEVYPGKVSAYLPWPEVRFVEDFINAFLKFKDDIDILNEEKQGKPGFDDYAPINPLETPLNDDSYFLSYKEIQRSGEIGNGAGFWRLIGERLFISLDHSYTQPIRVEVDGNTAFYPTPNSPNTNGTLSTTPLLKGVSSGFISALGSIDANNLLNTIEDFKVIYTVTTGEETEDVFVNKIIDELKKNGDFKELTLSNKSYYIYKPKKDNGGIRLNGIGISGSNPIVVKANPHKMELKDLFKIIPEGDDIVTNVRPIEIKNDTFKTKLENYSKIISENIPSSFNPDWEFLEAKSLVPGNQDVNIARIDSKTYKQQTPSFITDRLFITLDPLNGGDGGFFSVGKNISTWFSSDDISQIPPSSMSNWLAFDPQGVLGDIDDTSAIHLSNFIDINDINIVNRPAQIPGFLSPAAAGSPFVMTPLWLDNVNKFRQSAAGAGNVLSNGTLTQYDTDKIEKRNLAYLYLQNLKPTPLIIRETDDDMGMKSTGKDQRYVYPYSIKTLNSAAGIVKTPKAWVLAMGSILWRWKCFVGKNSNGKWNNPLKKVNPEIPNGFDPLSQPGFNNGPRLTGLDNPSLQPNEVSRNLIFSYLQKIYNSTAIAITIQKSVFKGDGYLNRKGAIRKNENNTLFEISRFGFDYYGIYQNNTNNPAGSNNPRVDLPANTNNGSSVYTSGLLKFNVLPTAQNWSQAYGWPQLWIAPHHIPYTHPISICANDNADDDENDASYFTVLSNDAWKTIDYQTMMPVTRGGGKIPNDLELEEYGRSLTNDGNLGYIMMNLPDEVKEEFVRVFEEWAESDEWVKDILPIVDPANFGGINDKMVTGYMVKKDSKDGKDFPVENGPTEDALFELKDDRTSVREKLLSQKYVLINSTPKMWLGVDESYYTDNSYEDYFIVDKEMFQSYLKAFKAEYNDGIANTVKALNEKDSKGKGEEALGQTLLEDDDVRLSLYRTFKSMADKWLSTDSEGKMFFNVTEDTNSSYCNSRQGLQIVGKDGKSTLATHFQYVSRTMVDIGSDAVIDITKLNVLKNNLKISLYQYLSDILTENNYLFFPLPSYINFGTNGMQPNDLLDMFRPTMSMKGVSCGPLFLAMYVGGNSRVLNINNFGGKVNCPIDLNALSDDGFDLSTGRNTPIEFKSPGKNDPGITAFRVVYGTENQNHFKNIQLDQSEFSETGESLLVIDKLAQQGGSDQTTKGQNLHNVYLTRSYTCQVESFGNVMIQPMTYFDLFGVPMFNGTYLITEVRHNFKPNHATTTFKGTRQPIATVPIITDAAIAMNLSLKEIKSSENRKSITQANTGGRTSVGTSTEIYANNEFTQVIVKDEPVKTPPTLNEILAVMRTKKGVFYSTKAESFVGRKMKDTKTKLIEGGVYDPKKAYIIYTEPYVVNIVGIRNFVQTPGSFDDYMAVFYKDPSCTSCKDGWQFKVWSVTTDPGITGQRMFTTNTDLGAGFIAEGQFIGSHISGQHTGPYSALHNTRPILVYRDPGDIWVEKDSSNLYVDRPGMNIHASGTYEKSGTKVNAVSNWSAGCQVFANPRDYMEFLDIIFTKAKNPEVVGKSTSIKIDNCAGWKSAGCEPLSKLKPNGSTLEENQSKPVREFTYTLLNTAEFGKPANITIGDTVYENYIPGGARAGTANSSDGGDIVKYNTIPSSPKETKKYYETILTKLGAPKTEGNLLFLRGWRQAEGGSATWNGFNTTLRLEGSTNYNKVPVQNYLTLEQGAQAIVDTLLKASNGSYANIVSSLKKGIKDQKEAEKIATDLQQKGKDLYCWVRGCKGTEPLDGYLAKVLKYTVGEGNVPKIV